jgi:hypothetical protein
MSDPPAVGTLAAGEAAPAEVAPALRIRLDVVLWLAVIGVAAALRFARLDALPLTIEESRRAFEAFRVSNDSVPDGWSGDLAGALTSYLFRIEESELILRLVPAAAGAAMIAALWLCGRVVGRAGALVAATLLAFSPLALVTSRTALPFAAGGLLSVLMIASLFSYLREPRATTAFLFALTLGLAPSTDAVATTAAIAVVAFLVLEAVFDDDGQVARAWAAFRGSPSHWLSAMLVAAAALELGLTHFGTSLDRLGLAGFSQWADMFALPRDGREPEYQLGVLLAYDWPLLLAGALAAAFFVARGVREGVGALASGPRLLLLWAALAVLAVSLATQREAGQLLMLLLPLALLAGLAVDELLPLVNWRTLARWWPAVALALGLVAYAALLATDWSQDGISSVQRIYFVLAVGGAAVVLSGCYSILGREASAVVLAVALVLAGTFLAHTDLTLTRKDERAEFAVDARTSPRIHLFRETVREILERRAGPTLIDPALEEPLSWYLRDLPVAFGQPDADAAAAVVPLGTEVPGFTASGEPWRLAEGWYPTDIEPLPLWRWLLFREQYGNLKSVTMVDVQIVVPRP